MDSRDISRRRFVATASTAGIAVGLAGCSGGGSSDDGGSGDGGGYGGGSESGDDATETSGDDSDDSGGGYSAVEQQVVDYLNEDPAEGTFDGSIVDETDADEVVVTVGADGNGADYAYAPVAVKITPGTTVSFEWKEGGSSHNVVSEDDSDISLDSGEPKQGGDPYVQSFDDPGAALYYCTPHRALGMKGGIVVVE